MSLITLNLRTYSLAQIKYPLLLVLKSLQQYVLVCNDDPLWDRCSFNPALQILNLRDCKLTKLDLSKTTNTLTTVEVFNNGHIYSNKFSACGLDSLYHSLPDRTGMTRCYRVISSITNPLYNNGEGNNKNIANAKNGDVMTYVETITGDGKGCVIDTA